MNMNNLPFDCLIKIFDYCYDFNDLMNFRKVCSIWRESIKSRLKKIKYFHFTGQMPTEESDSYNDYQFVLPDGIEMMKKVDISELFPNIMFLFDDIGLEWQKCTCNALTNILNSAKHIIEVSIAFGCFNESHISGIVKLCGDIQILRTESYRFFYSFFHKFKYGENLKCLFYSLTVEDFIEIAPNLINLEEIRINCSPNLWPTRYDDHMRYDKPMLIKLRTLYLNYSDKIDEILSFFPNLQELYYSIDIFQSYLTFGDFMGNSVEKLWFRISFTKYMKRPNSDHLQMVVDYMKGFMSRFPSCNHLELDGCPKMTEEDLLEIINSLPKLISLHLSSDIIHFMDITAQEAQVVIDRYNVSTKNRKIVLKITPSEPED